MRFEALRNITATLTSIALQVAAAQSSIRSIQADVVVSTLNDNVIDNHSTDNILSRMVQRPIKEQQMSAEMIDTAKTWKYRSPIFRLESVHEPKRRKTAIENDDEYTGSKTGKGKGMSMGSTKGTGKGMSMGSKGGKGGSNNELPSFCFGGGGKGKRGNKGKGKGSMDRDMNSRQLMLSKGQNMVRTLAKTRATKSKKGKKGSKSKKSPKCDDFDFGDFSDQPIINGASQSILDVAKELSEVSVFVSLVHRYDLSYIFECPGPFTGLIPTNDAFGLLDPITFSNLLLPQSNEMGELLILNHLLPGFREEMTFVEANLESLSGGDVAVTTNPLLFNGKATIVNADLSGSNGILHLIDRVLDDDDVVTDVCSSGDYDFSGPTEGQNCKDNVLHVACSIPELSIFLSLIDALGLSEILYCSGPFTLLVPTNEAFDELDISLDDTDILTDIMFYHILPGLFESDNIEAGSLDTLLTGQAVIVATDPIRFDNVSVVNADIEACNGILHILDGVLLPDNEITNQPSLSPMANPPTIAPVPIAPTISTKTPVASPNVTSSPSSTMDPETTLPTTTAPSPIDGGTFSPTTMPTRIIPSDLPSLIPVAVTSSPTPLSGSLQPVPTPVDATAPTGTPTITPIQTTAPASLTAPPSPILNTVAPTPLGSDRPSLTPLSTTLAPSVSATESPTESELRVDLNETFYIAFISESDVEPTPEEYEQLSVAIVEYYNDFIRASLMVSDPSLDFIRIEMDLNDTQNNAGIPDDRFNMYMEYSTAIAFFTPNGQGGLISTDDLLNLLLDGITTEFLLDPVRMQTGTPFEAVVEGFLQTLAP